MALHLSATVLLNVLFQKHYDCDKRMWFKMNFLDNLFWNSKRKKLEPKQVNLGEKTS